MLKTAFRYSYITICTLALSIFIIFLNIMLIYKSGTSISASLITPLIFYILFRIFFTPKKDELFKVQMFTTGASMSMFGLEIAYAANCVFGNKSVSLISLVVIALLMNIFALIISHPIINLVNRNDNFKFPKGQITADVIEFITSTKKKTKDVLQVLSSLIISLFISIIDNIISLVKYPFSLLGIPNYLGIELSPLLFGVGSLLDIKSALIMTLGMVYSVTIYLTTATSRMKFDNYQRNPLIISIAIGLILGGVIQMLPKLINTIRMAITSLRCNSKIKLRSNKYILLFSLFFLTVLVLFVLLSFYLLYIFNLSQMIWFIAFVVGIIISIAVIKIRAETGMGLSIGAYIFIPIIGILSHNIVATLIISGALVLMSIQSADYLESIKVANLLNVSNKLVTAFYCIGALLGAVSGSFIVVKIGELFKFGSTNLPIPTSISWGIQAQAVTGGILPNSISIPMIVFAIICGTILSYFRFSPSTLAIGILLPPSSISVMALGSLFSWLLKRKTSINPQNMSIGFITGEGLVMLFISVIMLFKI